MTQEQTISWIFMAIGMASSIGATDTKSISMTADAINHAVPTHHELQNSFKWLLEKKLIAEENKKYYLTDIGKVEFDKAMKRSGRFAIWERLEKTIRDYT